MVVWQKYLPDCLPESTDCYFPLSMPICRKIFSGRAVIQSLSREDVNFRRFDSMNEANFDANVAATRLAGGLQPIVELLMGAAVAIVINLRRFASHRPVNCLLGSLVVGLSCIPSDSLTPSAILSVWYSRVAARHGRRAAYLRSD